MISPSELHPVDDPIITLYELDRVLVKAGEEFNLPIGDDEPSSPLV